VQRDSYLLKIHVCYLLEEEIMEYSRISAMRSSQRAIPECLPVEPVDSHMVLLELAFPHSITNSKVLLLQLKENKKSSGIYPCLLRWSQGRGDGGRNAKWSKLLQA
jgi:hypothetical protein